MIKHLEIGRLSWISPEGRTLRVQKDESRRRPGDKIIEKLEATDTERSDQITGEKQGGAEGGGCQGNSK